MKCHYLRKERKNPYNPASLCSTSIFMLLFFFVSTWKSKRVYICAIKIILFSAILHAICFVPMVLRNHAFYAAVINSQLSIRTFMNSKY